MRRFVFPAEVWTTAETIDEAISQVRDLVSVAANSECGMAVDHQPTSSEEVDE